MKFHTHVYPLEKKTYLEKSRALRVYDSVADLIADPENPTPMIRLSERSRPSEGFEIYVKLSRCLFWIFCHS